MISPKPGRPATIYGERLVRVTVTLPPSILPQIRRARGREPLASWARRAILEALERESAAQRSHQ
jgi:hypothetical protein